MDTPVLAFHQGFTCISSGQTLDVIKRTYQERWTIGTDGKREPRDSVLSVLLNDDDDDELALRLFHRGGD